jgi:hypothetical protein
MSSDVGRTRTGIHPTIEFVTYRADQIAREYEDLFTQADRWISVWQLVDDEISEKGCGRC